MPSLEKMNVTLPAELVAQVQRAVDAGEYSTSSEVVREALTEWKTRRLVEQKEVDALREAWQEASQDTRPGVPLDGVFTRLKSRYAGQITPQA